jgi:osomolarity two-component system response regulator SKN7
MNAGSKYDLVLMDIIMPNLDGVSACHLIRQFDATPIIAMTSNIRSDDIQMYFQHGKKFPPGSSPHGADRCKGMDDVLPKPFTTEGLLNMLEKHLGHLKKLPDGMEMVPNTASTIGHGSNAQSIKDEASPGHSPSTVSNWNSPGQFSGISPTVSGPYMHHVHPPTGYGMDPGHGQMQFQPPQTPLGAPPRPVNHRRQVSEINGVDDIGGNDPKRPRIYAQTNAAMNNMRRGPSC